MNEADLCQKMREAIEREIEGAKARVVAVTPGHFEVRVVSDAFEGKRRVAQQQLVYRAIGPFMSGPDAPVHAIDRLETLASE